MGAGGLSCADEPVGRASRISVAACFGSRRRRRQCASAPIRAWCSPTASSSSAARPRSRSPRASSPARSPPSSSGTKWLVDAGVLLVGAGGRFQRRHHRRCWSATGARANKVDSAEHWLRWIGISALANGACWGFAGAVFFPSLRRRGAGLPRLPASSAWRRSASRSTPPPGRSSPCTRGGILLPFVYVLAHLRRPPVQRHRPAGARSSTPCA